MKGSQTSPVDTFGKNIPIGPPGEALALVEAWNQRMWSSDPRPEWTWPKGKIPKFSRAGVQ